MAKQTQVGIHDRIYIQMAAMVGQMEKIEILMVNGRHLISPNVFCFRSENSAKPAKKIQTPIETVISAELTG